ncbi:MAG: NAD-dependent epimerase/dehydratase family protein [Candidatus Diapherotrites archaeon]|nr:NAD-dependent epimerase/dehydratase family protein [Candidatus Diapherotrites archaeon]
MNILITGSTGLIGKELTKQLKAKQGHKIKEFSKSLGQDILNKEDVQKALSGVDAVVHLAALLDETLSLEELRKVNVHGTENLLEECAKQKIERLIYLSSVAVYGSTGEISTEESKFSPETNYELSKAESEKLVQTYQELIPITILRPALVYGPTSYWEEITKIAKKGFPIIGDGKNQIQLVNYKDVANAIVFCLEREETIGETYNVAEKQIITYTELQKNLTEALGLEFKEKHISVFMAQILTTINSIVSKISGKKTMMIPQNIPRIIKNRLYNVSKFEKAGWKAKHEFKTDLKDAMKEN